jgi:protein-disulfide isomerase
MSQEAKVLTGIGIVTLLVVIGAAFLFGGSPSAEKPNPKISTEQMKVVVREDSHVLGTKGAKITLVEFGDFQCPACAATHPIVSQLLTEYKGKVTFVFRNYPLAIHQNAKISAEAAEAAGAQGKFFEMYDALYQNQQEWAESKNPLEYFQKYAQAIGLDVDKFTEEVKANKYKNKIEKDVADGNALGVSATPSFFINGEKITGGLPYDEFKAKFDAILKGS